MQAAERLKVTAPELCKLQIADGIIPVRSHWLCLFFFSS